MLWLPLSLLVLSALAHASRLQPRIMGGRTASKGEYPFVVYMHNGAEKTFCGGSIIGQQWILTAAHCIKTAKANDITVAKVVVHPQYNDNSMVNDIAMLQLSTNITWSDSVQPIDIDTASVTALGWGFTSPTGKSASKDLKEGPLTTPVHTQFNGNNGKRICVAGDTGTDTCPGDSGGPLIRQVNGKNMLLGITSFGTAGPGASITVNCGGAGMVSLFTHANAFLSYIQTTTRFDESQFNSSGAASHFSKHSLSSSLLVIIGITVAATLF
ncbi:trypsin-like serine protease [Linderina pennispora]|uniref:Trypsin-like serine protease n=1 Tax=Linderina pennispora TaxID=61395 RepID=A0A1Y1WAD6_9FUNG|nr:trypsin-like serine protease [Linderina pennispora]ORX70491.1 trypsin-like serine protease [Linderina pennispora]